jgi:hypothetical protein
MNGCHVDATVEDCHGRLLKKTVNTRWRIDGEIEREREIDGWMDRYRDRSIDRSIDRQRPR